MSTITCDLGAVFELIGATSACALAYILPPMCYLKLASRSWRTVPAVACVLFGFLVMTISLVQALMKIIGSEFCFSTFLASTLFRSLYGLGDQRVFPLESLEMWMLMMK